MNNNLLILGAGGHGRVVKETAKAMGYFNKIEFLDDNSEVAIGKCKDFKRFVRDYNYAFVAFGNNDMRMKWIKDLNKVGFKLPKLIHPTAYVSSTARISEGTIICAKAVVNTNAVVGKGSIISIGTLIDHDSFVGECSHINTGAIIKAGCIVSMLSKIDAGIVYDGESGFKEYSFEVGV